ncbi:NAD(P)-dependent oxidoreductase [Pasteurella caecimuris]|uniref:NAD-dependent epimerase/dehydratase family protein n=1 Tax=Rodentibacter caecimuris TaxID=1796644 RepID=UPI00214FD533|nr:NAD(P)-dependent oxidoreductase [Pasteurella caecimuris]MCR1838343.1 NAD(P)-dependent oxidoreductase [Pasteurella caecimuris]MCU0107546.1 NAD(P)-dependent oxidoreductase [Pasteurella caecimuris]
MKKSLIALTFSLTISTSALAETIFLAGATGVVGEPLGKALVEAGHTVYGTSRSADRAKALEVNGVKPVVLDVFDAKAVEKAIANVKPDVVINQVSSLPKGLKESEMPEGLKRDAKVRVEGTKNLVAAAEKAGVKKFINQSFLYYFPTDKKITETDVLVGEDDPIYGESVKALKEVEMRTLAGKFTPVVLRFGWLYGGKSGFDAPIEGYPSVNVDIAVAAIVKAVKADLNGLYNIAEESPMIDLSKFQKVVPEWKSHK